MEHRHTTARHQCDIKVLIYRHGNPIAFGRIKNFSSQGMLVETDYKDIHLTQQLKFEIILDKLGSSGDKIFIDVLVVHITKNGFGAEMDIPIAEHIELFFSYFKGAPLQQENREICSVAVGH
ncbi:MAG: PilZ domain-containing protein [Candidatus Saccharibacteria bacterium]|nr:PilZ domain-containing protein [Candidatus Saccharibacteria bacterium]